MKLINRCLPAFIDFALVYSYKLKMTPLSIKLPFRNSGSSVMRIGFRQPNRELSICTTDGFCNGRIINVASSPRRLSGPLRVVELEGPMDDKFNWMIHE